jgi:hypothetical protein
LVAVFVHQRAKHEEFKPTIVRQRSELLTALFQGSPLTVTGKVSLGATGRAPFVDGACELVNYLPLADMKLRSKTTAPEGTVFIGSTFFRAIDHHKQ